MDEESILNELTDMAPQSVKTRSKRLIDERNLLIRECFVEAKRHCMSASTMLTAIEDSLLQNGAIDARKQIVARLNTLSGAFDNAFKSLDLRSEGTDG